MTDVERVRFVAESDFSAVLGDMEKLRASSAGLGAQLEKGASQGLGARFNKSIDKASAKLTGLGNKMSATGRSLTTGLTLPIIGVGVGALKMAINFEQAFTGIKKTLDVSGLSASQTAAEFLRIEEGIREMALRVPLAVEELAKIGELGGQLGIERDNLLDFTEVIAEIGVASNLSTEQAATGFARFGNILGTPQTELRAVGDIIIELGNNLATTESEILDFGLRIAGAGKLAGLSEGDILAIGAAMSSVGIQAEAGGTATQKVLLGITEAVATGNDDLEIFARTAGLTAEEFGQVWQTDAAGGFQLFVDGLGRAGTDAFQILEELGLQDQRLIRSFLSLAGAGDVLTNAFELSKNATGALKTESELFFASTGNQGKLVLNQLKDVAIDLGQALIPFLKEFFEIFKEDILPILQAGVDAFKNLSPPAKRFVVVGLTLVAALGPVLLIFGSILKTLGALLPVLKLFGGAIKGVSFALSFLAAHPIVAVILVLIALAILIVKNWDVVGPFFGKMWQAVVGFFKAAWELIKNIVGVAFDFLKNLFFNFHPLGIIIKNWKPIAAFFAGLWDSVKAIIGSAINVLKFIFFNFTPLGLIIQHWETIVGFFKGLWDGVTATISGAIDIIKGVLLSIKATIDAVVGFFSNLWDRIKGAFGKVVEGIKTAVQKAKNFLSGLNPFSKGSPSLVENVQEGVKVIRLQYADLDDLKVRAPKLGDPDTATTGPTGGALSVFIDGINSRLLPIPVTGGGGGGGVGTSGGTGGGDGDGESLSEVGDRISSSVSSGASATSSAVLDSGADIVSTYQDGIRNDSGWQSRNDRLMNGLAATIDSNAPPTAFEIADAIARDREQKIRTEMNRADRRFFQGQFERFGQPDDPSFQREVAERLAGTPAEREGARFRAFDEIQTATAPPVTRDPKIRGGDQFIVNNPVAQETEDSLRKISTRRSFMGANAGPDDELIRRTSARRPGKKRRATQTTDAFLPTERTSGPI